MKQECWKETVCEQVWGCNQWKTKRAIMQAINKWAMKWNKIADKKHSECQ